MEIIDSGIVFLLKSAFRALAYLRRTSIDRKLHAKSLVSLMQINRRLVSLSSAGHFVRQPCLRLDMDQKVPVLDAQHVPTGSTKRKALGDAERYPLEFPFPNFFDLKPQGFTGSFKKRALRWWINGIEGYQRFDRRAS